MKKIRLLSLLLVAALFVQNAAATMLPYSSHYQGCSYFDDAGVTGHVDFAVYDTLGPYGNEWAEATGFDVPWGDDQYIYAYQIFNDIGSTAIEFFTIWGIDDYVLSINNMNKQDPQEGDYPIFGLDFVEPTGFGTNNSGEQAWWQFEGGTLVAGKDSWFLIFSSDNHWTLGKYEVQPAGGFPITGTPEPCTLALLGLGGAILFAKRRNSVKSYKIRSQN